MEGRGFVSVEDCLGDRKADGIRMRMRDEGISDFEFGKCCLLRVSAEGGGRLWVVGRHAGSGLR